MYFACINVSDLNFHSIRPVFLFWPSWIIKLLLCSSRAYCILGKYNVPGGIIVGNSRLTTLWYTPLITCLVNFQRYPRSNMISGNYLESDWLGFFFGGLIICTSIIFYWTRTLFYTKLILYLDNTRKSRFYIKMFIFVIYRPIENLNNVRLL